MSRRVVLALAATAALAGGAWAQDPENVLVLEIAGQANGTVEIELLPEVAPQHVEQIKTLAREGAYDDVAFHRVIEGFMAQTGDVQFGKRDVFADGRAGTGGSELPDLPAEFSDVSFDRGTVGMARAQSPDSANSQFFIMFAPGPFLDGQYTVVGQVLSGMEVVDEIQRGSGQSGSVADPDYIVSAKIKGDG
jgi:peptidylprolyl isomerase